MVVKQIAVNKEAQEYTNKLRENCLNVLEKLLYVVEQQWRVFKECQNSIYDARDKYADRLQSNDHKLAGKINIGKDFKIIYPYKINSILCDSHFSAQVRCSNSNQNALYHFYMNCINYIIFFSYNPAAYTLYDIKYTL